jgi:hypothetical protein
MKWVANGLSTSVVLLGMGIALAHSETAVERGAYLMRGIVACGNCHTPRDQDGKPIADQELAGGVVVNTPIFRAVSSNITPDPETGIGKWTDDQIVNAIRATSWLDVRTMAKTGDSTPNLDYLVMIQRAKWR